MSILINKNTRVVTQGITGKTGQFHTRMSRDYANGRNCFVAGVHPKKAGENFEVIPIYATVLGRDSGKSVKLRFVASLRATPLVNHCTSRLWVAGCSRERVKVSAWVVDTERFVLAGEKPSTGRTC